MKYLMLICAALMFAACAAATDEDKTSAGAETFAPRLLALSVEDLDASVRWYEEIFEFEQTARFDFSDDGMRMAFMARGGFELEMIELAGSAPFDAPDSANSSSRRGLAKFAFDTGDIDALYARAQVKGAVIHSPLSNSNRTGGRFFILLDPDGNWIQVFGK